MRAHTHDSISFSHPLAHFHRRHDTPAFFPSSSSHSFSPSPTQMSTCRLTGISTHVHIHTQNQRQVYTYRNRHTWAVCLVSSWLLGSALLLLFLSSPSFNMDAVCVYSLMSVTKCPSLFCGVCLEVVGVFTSNLCADLKLNVSVTD